MGVKTVEMHANPASIIGLASDQRRPTISSNGQTRKQAGNSTAPLIINDKKSLTGKFDILYVKQL